MKKLTTIGFIACILFIVGCAAVIDEINKINTAIEDTIALTGKLADTVESYKVVAINNVTNAIHSIDTDANGNFSIDLPKDASYLVSLLKDGSYVGPAIFGKAASEVNTAIKPLENLDLGSIAVDLAKGIATLATTPNAIDASVISKALNGVPLGAGNFGKTKNSSVTNRSDADLDMDGIPNLFDADEDNDGIRNGIIAEHSTKAVVSDVVESVFMASNIWATHGTNANAEDIIAMRLHVTPKSGQESKIASVKCTSVPPSIKEVATVRWAGSLGNPTNYPTENSIWKNSGYGLYKTTTFSENKWIISIAPKAQMNVGDTFTIRVTFTDSTYKDFFITLAYILTDWAKISSYNGTTMPTDKGQYSDPVVVTSNSTEITISKAKDEDGNILEGLSYSVIYGIVTDAPVPGNSTEVRITNNATETLTFSVPTTQNATYYVTPVAESFDGQRNGAETWFTKQ